MPRGKGILPAHPLRHTWLVAPRAPSPPHADAADHKESGSGMDSNRAQAPLQGRYWLTVAFVMLALIPDLLLSAVVLMPPLTRRAATAPSCGPFLCAAL